MTLIKLISVYQTSDGQLFEVYRDAEKHQAELDFDAWYYNNSCLGNYAGSSVECNFMKDWLRENRKVILAFLSLKESQNDKR